MTTTEHSTDQHSTAQHSTVHQHTTSCWWNPDRGGWTCPPADAGRADPPLVDVRDMIVVHGALLREFRLLAEALEGIPVPSERWAATARRHLGLLCDLLHHHHAGEDALLWPLLRTRVPAAALERLDVAEDQHAGLDASLRRVRDASETWPSSRDGRLALAEELRRLHDLLDTHLDLEERALLPLAAGLLTEQEWHAIGEAAVASLPKSVLPLVFGMFAYEGDPVVLAAMLQSAPALPRKVLPRIAPRVYARRAARVYGTATP